MTAAGRMSAASAVAAMAAGVPIVALTEDRSFLALAGALVALSVALGLLARHGGSGEVVVRLVQLLPAALVPWLAPAASEPLALYAETAEFVRESFAPMPYQSGVALFSALLLWVLYLLVETLAVGLASPAWTFPVLVLPYLVPTVAIYAETSPALFAFPAAGYALVLATASRNAAAGPPGTHEATAAGWRRGVLTAATIATTLALAGAVLAAQPIPERFGDRTDTFGQGTVQLGDPSIDLIRNINATADRTVLTYRTSDGEGQYLRLAALSAFDEKGFHLVATDLVALQFGGDLPRVGSTQAVETSVEVGDLASEYLPMPWFPVAAEVPGDNWRYDPRTLAVVAVGDGRATATRDLAYTARTARLPGLETMLPTLAEPGEPGDGGLTLALPPGLPDSVRRLAVEVTTRAGAETAGEKALALASFLRSDAFRYNTRVAPGTTLSTLEDFLLGSRTGYCEQFAGSLAVLARAVGIPSRVVVGFLPGTERGERWEVSTRNMHAWVELSFGNGVGWVPVDPTPGGATAGGGGTSSASAVPSSAPTPTVPTAAPTTVDDPALPGAGAQDGLAAGGPGWLGGAAALALVLGAAPRLVRAAQRRSRLRPGSDPARAGERAWREVRAVVLDHAGPWPDGTSRQVATQLGSGLDEDGREALWALAVTVERGRYDREPAAADALPALVGRVSRAVERRWAVPTAGKWWPRSLWRPGR